MPDNRSLGIVTGNTNDQILLDIKRFWIFWCLCNRVVD